MGTDRSEIEAGLIGALDYSGLTELTRMAMLFELRECERRVAIMKQMLATSEELSESLRGPQQQRLQRRVEVVEARVVEIVDQLWPLPDEPEPGVTVEIPGR